MKKQPNWTLPPPGTKYNIELDTLIETAKAEVNLHATMAAQIWAKDFMNIFIELYGTKIFDSNTGGNTSQNTIEECNNFLEWMHSWFANAIMCGYDHMARKRDKEYIYILQSNSGSIVKVFHYEPSVKDMAKAYAQYLNCDDDAICKGSIEINTILYRWARDKGLMVWDGKKEVDDSRYNWKVEN